MAVVRAPEPVPASQCDQHVANIFGVHDLGLAGDVPQQVVQLRLEQGKKFAQMSLDTAAPGQADEIIMAGHAEVRLKCRSWFQGENEMAFTFSHKLDEIASLCSVKGGF
jgi:hypothetical protein